MGERESTGGLLALGAVGMGVCCGLPLLLAAGGLGALAGIGLGSWLVICVGLMVAAVGAARWYLRHNDPACESPTAQDSVESVVDDRTI